MGSRSGEATGIDCIDGANASAGADERPRIPDFRTTTRHKSGERRLRRDLRIWLPLFGFLCCYSISATAIVVTELVASIASARGASGLASVASGPDHFLTISSSSTSKTSAALGGMRGNAPRLP